MTDRDIQAFDKNYLETAEVTSSALYRTKKLFEVKRYKEWFYNQIDAYVDQCVDYLKIRDDALILDFGCGIGGVSIGIEKKKKCRLIGFEIDKELVKFAVARSKYEGTNCNFCLCVGERLPFKSNQFDFVLAKHILEHVNDVESCLMEMMRVLKTDGRAFINPQNRLAIYALGYSNWRTQMTRFYLGLRGIEMNWIEHGRDHYNRLFTIVGLRKIFKKLNINYKIKTPQKNDLFSRILISARMYPMFKRQFEIILEKR